MKDAICLTIGLLGWLGPCSPTLATAKLRRGRWRTWWNAIRRIEWRLERKYGIPTSAEESDRLRRFDEDDLHQLDGIDFDALDQSGKVDYLLLASKLRFEGRQLDHEQKQIGRDSAADSVRWR